MVGVACPVAFADTFVAIDTCRPRNPEESPLYGVVAEHLETFLDRQRERDRNVPGFVEREFREFLNCGILAEGFIRVHSDACGLDRVVPFSCKKRGFCNSCCGRRMSDTAAHLVDRVFPRVPVRQWVLSFPYALRYRLAYDADMVRGVLGIFTRTVFGSLIRRAIPLGAKPNAQCGAVTFIQRFGSALNLNLHLHMLAINGVYAADDDGNPRFHAVPAPGTTKSPDWPGRWPNVSQNGSSVVAWDPTPILKRPIRSRAINRGWPASMPPPYRAGRHSDPTPVDA